LPSTATDTTLILVQQRTCAYSTWAVLYAPQTIDGINRCLPDLPKRVRSERIVMVRNLLMHTCAEHEGALAEHGPKSRSAWPVAGEGLIDAIVGLWCAPVHVSAAGQPSETRQRTDRGAP